MRTLPGYMAAQRGGNGRLVTNPYTKSGGRSLMLRTGHQSTGTVAAHTVDHSKKGNSLSNRSVVCNS
jgi:hypothetical protein